MVKNWLEYYWNVFVGEFLDHIPIVGALLVLIVIVAGGLRGLGVPYLFWHDSKVHRFVAGFAAGMLLAMAFFVAYLLDAPDCLEQGAGRYLATAGLHPWKGGCYFLGCLLCLVASLAVLMIGLPVLGRLFLVPSDEKRQRRAERRSGTHRWVGAGRWPLFSAAFLAGLLVASLIWWSAEEGVLGGLLDRLTFIDRIMLRSGEPFVNGHRLAAVVAAVLLLIIVTGWHGGRRHLPASLSICALLGLVMAGDGFLAYSLHESPIVALVVLGCLLMLTGREPYRVRLQALAAHYRSPRELTADDERWWLGDASAVTLRAPSFSADPAAPTLVLVAVSGGGLRAALWTAAVLSELEEAGVVTPRNIALITGASGGMVGATYYTLTLSPSGSGRAWTHVLPRERLLDAVGQESLSDIAQRMVFHDIPAALWPFSRWSKEDRGTRLDQTLERHLTDAFDSYRDDLVRNGDQASRAELLRRLDAARQHGRSMAALQPFEQEGQFPSLAYTPMLIEDGRRLFISNADLDPLATSHGPQLDPASRELYSRSALELHRLFPGSLEKLTPWTAARLSASFPYVTPAPVLPTSPRRRVVDAGYWDNYGVNLCAGWIEDALGNDERRAWLGNFKNVLLLQIRDGVLDYSARKPPGKDAERSRALTRGTEWLSSPPAAVLAARNAVTVYRGDEQVEALAEEFPASSFTTAVVDMPGSASLSWSLTDAERAEIRRAATAQVGRMKEQLARFVTPADRPVPRPRCFHHTHPNLPAQHLDPEPPAPSVREGRSPHRAARDRRAAESP